MKATKVYLGDGAYASFSGWDIVVTAENGISVQNRGHLERPALEELIRFAKSVGMIK